MKRLLLKTQLAYLLTVFFSFAHPHRAAGGLCESTVASEAAPGDLGEQFPLSGEFSPQVYQRLRLMAGRLVRSDFYFDELRSRGDLEQVAVIAAWEFLEENSSVANDALVRKVMKNALTRFTLSSSGISMHSWAMYVRIREANSELLTASLRKYPVTDEVLASYLGFSVTKVADYRILRRLLFCESRSDTLNLCQNEFDPPSDNAENQVPTRHFLAAALSLRGLTPGQIARVFRANNIGHPDNTTWKATEIGNLLAREEMPPLTLADTSLPDIPAFSTSSIRRLAESLLQGVPRANLAAHIDSPTAPDLNALFDQLHKEIIVSQYRNVESPRSQVNHIIMLFRRLNYDDLTISQILNKHHIEKRTPGSQWTANSVRLRAAEYSTGIAVKYRGDFDHLPWRPLLAESVVRERLSKPTLSDDENSLGDFAIEMYRAGYSTTEICQYFSSAELPPPEGGRFWNPERVLETLLHPKQQAKIREVVARDLSLNEHVNAAIRLLDEVALSPLQIAQILDWQGVLTPDKELWTARRVFLALLPD